METVYSIRKDIKGMATKFYQDRYSTPDYVEGTTGWPKWNSSL